LRSDGQATASRCGNRIYRGALWARSSWRAPWLRPQRTQNRKSRDEKCVAGMLRRSRVIRAFASLQKKKNARQLSRHEFLRRIASKRPTDSCAKGDPKDDPQIAGISVKRFSRFLRSNKLAKFKDGRWRITDRRLREITIISDGQARLIQVRGFNPASLAMRHRAAVRQFLDSNDVTLLSPFKGQTVTDVAKQKHTLETRPNQLYRFANAGSDADMKIYRLT
jgi:hypothetical protein